MERERSAAPQPPPPAPPAVPAERSRRYEPPAVCWEQPFVALAQVSGEPGCNIPGACEDIP